MWEEKREYNRRKNKSGEEGAERKMSGGERERGRKELRERKRKGLMK